MYFAPRCLDAVRRGQLVDGSAGGGAVQLTGIVGATAWFGVGPEVAAQLLATADGNPRNTRRSVGTAIRSGGAG